jgi:NAD+--dinitrogen-reductase ADP-D-ribosyltransferase
MTEPLNADGSIATVGNSSNLVGVPTGLLASVSFNDFPISLYIRGTREAHAGLFASLNQAGTLEMARQRFYEYMRNTFTLEKKRRGARRFHASYLQVLEDWGFDANSAAGAVLKGWVESRFGLFPTFHKDPIRRFNSPAWIVYMEEKMSSRFNNNDIQTQFDLLYEFCQWALLRFVATGKKHLSLYRGTNDLRDQQMVQSIDSRTAIVRMNNLASFTSHRGIADEFGDTIIEAEVPVVKILCFNALLAPHTLRGESEYLVIGGDYRVRMSYW